MADFYIFKQYPQGDSWAHSENRGDRFRNLGIITVIEAENFEDARQRFKILGGYFGIDTTYDCDCEQCAESERFSFPARHSQLPSRTELMQMCNVWDFDTWHPQVPPVLIHWLNGDRNYIPFRDVENCLYPEDDFDIIDDDDPYDDYGDYDDEPEERDLDNPF